MSSAVTQPKLLLAANTSCYLHNYLLPLLQDLRRQGYDVDLLAPADSHTPRLQEQGFRCHAWVVPRRSLNPLRDSRPWWICCAWPCGPSARRAALVFQNADDLEQLVGLGITNSSFACQGLWDAGHRFVLLVARALDDGNPSSLTAAQLEQQLLLLELPRSPGLAAGRSVVDEFRVGLLNEQTHAA